MFLGTVDLTIQTTNPLQYTLVDEYYILGDVYSFLINYDSNWGLEPDLAVQWAQVNSNPSTWEFRLAHNAYFVDPRGCTSDGQGHIVDCPTKTNVRATDVKFTFDYVKQYRTQTSYYVDLVEHIASVELTSDPYFVRIVFDGPYAPAMATFTGVPILPEYIWSPGGVDVAPAWTNALPLGSGPYMVRPVGTTFAMVTPPPLIFDRNPVWHGKEVQGRQVFPDTIFYESYTTSGAMAVDLTLGKIDMALGPNAQDYTTFLAGKPGIIRRSLYDGFEAEQAINVLPDDLRDFFASISNRPLNLGHTNPVLLNQVVRTAIHMVTDRNKMITNALNGLGQPGDTIAPSSSPVHFSVAAYSTDDKNGDGNPYDFPPFAPLALEQFPDGPGAIPQARTILVQAGWAYSCATGALQTGVEFPLCQRDAGGRMINPLTFRFSTFNTEPWWETAARGVIEDAAKAGIQLVLELVNGSQMYNLWYRLDYEVWLWDWVWTPITDISTFMSVQTCHGISTLDNDNGYCLVDPVTGRWTFDDLYNQTLVETDAATRQAIANQMSQLIYGFASYNLPFYRAELYGMNEVRWTNWVDFNANRAVPPDAGNTPILGQIVYPVSAKPPQFTLSNFEGVEGQPVQFSVAAIDPQGGPVRYRWDFDTSLEAGGAGVNADAIPYNDDQGGNSATTTWTYPTAGTYGIALRVSQDGGDFFTVKKAQVTIHAQGVGNPVISDMSFSPFDPTTSAGDPVQVAASASDPAGLALTQYTWNWGDGSTPVNTVVPTASHQYATVGTFTAQVTVRNSAGATQSRSTIIPVVANVAPVIAPLQSQVVTVGTPNTYVAFASDVNSRDTLTYSWTFGDGSTGTGNPVDHTYASISTPTLTVTVSDGHGHTSSQSTTINVVSDRNTAPRINSLTPSLTATYTTLPMQITADVTDHEGNSLDWKWDFNNDNVVDLQYITPPSSPDIPQIRTETYLYTSPSNNQRAALTVTDVPPTGNPRSASATTIQFAVAANAAPTLTDIVASSTIGSPGDLLSFSSTSSDADGNRVSYVWDWGDGTSTSGQTGLGGGLIASSHSYAFDGSYVVVLAANDGRGGEARRSILITIVPKVTMSITVTSARREMMSAEVAIVHVSLLRTSDSAPVSTATLTPSTPLGGTFSSVRNLGSGNYEFDWAPPTVTRQTFAPINVIARAPTYYDISGRIVLLIDPNKTDIINPTQLFLLVRSPATSLPAGTSITVTVYLYTIEGYVVSGATLAVLRVGPGTVTLAVDQLNGVYTFTYTAPASVPGPTGVLITISASKLGYANGTARLALTVTP